MINWSLSDEMKTSFRDVILFMRSLGMTRLAYSGIDIELGPVPYPVASAESEKPQPELKCACGHLLDTEHTESGCLRGCDLGKCGLPKEEPAS